MFSSRRGAPGGAKSPRALLHALHHYALRAKIILTDFNLACFNPDRQTAKFKSLPNFPAIRYVTGMRGGHREGSA